VGVLEDVKSLASTIQKIDNIELYRKILDLQAEIMKLLEEKAASAEETRALRERLAIREALVFRQDCYWRGTGGGEQDGPFCSNCWDSGGKLIRMHRLGNPKYRECPACKTQVNLEGPSPRSGSVPIVRG